MSIASWLNRLTRSGNAPFVQPGESALPRHYSPHPFGDMCEHGVQFLNQCDQCEGGWQPCPQEKE